MFGCGNTKTQSIGGTRLDTGGAQKTVAGAHPVSLPCHGIIKNCGVRQTRRFAFATIDECIMINLDAEQA